MTKTASPLAGRLDSSPPQHQRRQSAAHSPPSSNSSLSQRPKEDASGALNEPQLSATPSSDNSRPSNPRSKASPALHAPSQQPNAKLRTSARVNSTGSGTTSPASASTSDTHSQSSSSTLAHGSTTSTVPSELHRHSPFSPPLVTPFNTNATEVSATTATPQPPPQPSRPKTKTVAEASSSLQNASTPSLLNAANEQQRILPPLSPLSSARAVAAQLTVLASEAAALVPTFPTPSEAAALALSTMDLSGMDIETRRKLQRKERDRARRAAQAAVRNAERAARKAKEAEEEVKKLEREAKRRRIASSTSADGSQGKSTSLLEEDVDLDSESDAPVNTVSTARRTGSGPIRHKEESQAQSLATDSQSFYGDDDDDDIDMLSASSRSRLSQSKRPRVGPSKAKIDTLDESELADVSMAHSDHVDIDHPNKSSSASGTSANQILERQSRSGSAAHRFPRSLTANVPERSRSRSSSPAEASAYLAAQSRMISDSSLLAVPRLGSGTASDAFPTSIAGASGDVLAPKTQLFNPLLQSPLLLPIHSSPIPRADGSVALHIPISIAHGSVNVTHDHQSDIRSINPGFGSNGMMRMIGGVRKNRGQSSQIAASGAAPEQADAFTSTSQREASRQSGSLNVLGSAFTPTQGGLGLEIGDAKQAPPSPVGPAPRRPLTEDELALAQLQYQYQCAYTASTGARSSSRSRSIIPLRAHAAAGAARLTRGRHGRTENAEFSDSDADMEGSTPHAPAQARGPISAAAIALRRQRAGSSSNSVRRAGSRHAFSHHHPPFYFGGSAAADLLDAGYVSSSALSDEGASASENEDFSKAMLHFDYGNASVDELDGVHVRRKHQQKQKAYLKSAGSGVTIGGSPLVKTLERCPQDDEEEEQHCGVSQIGATAPRTSTPVKISPPTDIFGSGASSSESSVTSSASIGAGVNTAATTLQSTPIQSPTDGEMKSLLARGTQTQINGLGLGVGLGLSLEVEKSASTSSPSPTISDVGTSGYFSPGGRGSQSSVSSLSGLSTSTAGTQKGLLDESVLKAVPALSLDGTDLLSLESSRISTVAHGPGGIVSTLAAPMDTKGVATPSRTRSKAHIQSSTVRSTSEESKPSMSTASATPNMRDIEAMSDITAVHALSPHSPGPWEQALASSSENAIQHDAATANTQHVSKSSKKDGFGERRTRHARAAKATLVVPTEDEKLKQPSSPGPVSASFREGAIVTRTRSGSLRQRGVKRKAGGELVASNDIRASSISGPAADGDVYFEAPEDVALSELDGVW
ncbi:hypothetical protein OC846_003677 [Tilletia horrida]|uniref:Uncharacterized protein n=1 Tax=Tilletia horrida TaxID=155126 RepID=A0AAN6GQ33_9BASI|nr:hypothetical protein OC846_003677 [Tilletia horrida]